MWKRCEWFFICTIVVLFTGCNGCIEQFDPTGDWEKFHQERQTAHEDQLELNDNGSMPENLLPSEEAEVAQNPIDKKYQSFCSSCHGVNGAGDGAAAAAMNPAPRNFVTWNDSSITDEYIAKIIKEGGAAVGKSPLMAAWGGVLNDEEVAAMVEKVRSFSNN